MERALVGHVTDSHRLLLKLHLEHIDEVNAKVQALEAAIARALPPFDENDLLARLDPIPGVNQIVSHRG